MKNKKNLFILSGLGIAAGAAAAAYFLKNKKNKVSDEHLLTSDSEDEIYFNYIEDTSLSYTEAEEKAVAAAKAKLGKGVAVVSASDKKALTVNVGGVSRHCFMFGASCDSLSPIAETVIFYVDASSGEVFDSSSQD